MFILGDFMGRYFGTDGFRGEYGRELTDAHAELIGRFLGEFYGDGSRENQPTYNEKTEVICGKKKSDKLKEDTAKKGARILIGKDTRKSSDLLEVAVARGIRAAGGEAILLGVCTTPAVAFLVRELHADGAIMITASHNPWGDNGIKIFDSQGLKLDDETTGKIEDFIDENLKLKAGNEGIAALNEKKPNENFSVEKIRLYEEHLCSFGADFSGMKIGLDCANGAAFAIAPRAFCALGAEVFTIGTEPDGENINRGLGSTNIAALMDFVKKNDLDLGFAFDGDGDRCITVNREGEVLDGDCEMLNLALDMLSRGKLKAGKVALTVMSNLGLVRELEKHGIGAEICPVGDRFVAEKMRELGLTLGGEQSGHIIIGDEVTGDGILTAICLTKIAKERGFLQNFMPTPQISENVRVREKGWIMGDKRLEIALSEARLELGDEGRILLRPSGTENLIRIMVEHQIPEKCKLIVSKIADLVRKIDKDGVL